MPVTVKLFQNGEQTNTTQNLLANPEPESQSFHIKRLLNF